MATDIKPGDFVHITPNAGKDCVPAIVTRAGWQEGEQVVAFRWGMHYHTYAQQVKDGAKPKPGTWHLVNNPGCTKLTVLLETGDLPIAPTEEVESA